MKFILYDFEVYKHDWLVVFKEPSKEHTVIYNDTEKLKGFFNQHKNNIFVGFNNRHYDDYILKAILSDINPKVVNDWIIRDEKKGWEFPNLNGIYFLSLDLRSDIPGGIGLSLKEIESNLGLNIEESSVPFDIDRKLTLEEIKDTEFYCKHDVDATEQLYYQRFDYIKSKLQIINAFKLPIRCISMTNAQLTAEVMGARKRKYYDENIYDMPDCVDVKDAEVLRFFENPQDATRHLEKDICSVPHTIAYGGLHGAIEKFHSKGQLYNFDVSSYYPSMIIKFNFMSRNVPDKNKPLYKKIRDDRFVYKKEGNSLADAYKLILNTLFGAMGYIYNKLYDLKMNRQVCITGQLLLIDLLEKLKPYIKLIQSNTDGILFQIENEENLDIARKIIKQWEEKTGLQMEEDTVEEIYQKDVNNYIMLEKNGDIKTKGGYVKNYSIKKGKERFGNYVSNSMTIIDEAIVKNLLYKTPVEDTIFECNDPIRFQITTKKGPTYKRVVWEVDGKEIDTNNVNRVFASGDEKYGKLIKIKQNGRRDTIASLPEHCLVYNDDLINFDINLIDKYWYVREAKNRIKDFIGG